MGWLLGFSQRDNSCSTKFCRDPSGGSWIEPSRLWSLHPFQTEKLWFSSDILDFQKRVCLKKIFTALVKKLNTSVLQGLQNPSPLPYSRSWEGLSGDSLAHCIFLGEDLSFFPDLTSLPEAKGNFHFPRLPRHKSSQVGRIMTRNKNWKCNQQVQSLAPRHKGRASTQWSWLENAEVKWKSGHSLSDQ